ncbi:12090_t:CDS:2, partial [Acaulospora colombiana]
MRLEIGTQSSDSWWDYFATATSNSSTWSELESQLRTLFKIPGTLKIIASYLDEDGDNITLSSDLELQEVIYQSSSGVPIRLVLTTFPADVEKTAIAMEQLKINDNIRVHFARPEPESAETETETEREGKYNDFDYTSTEEEADQNSSDPEIYFIIANSRYSRRGPKFGYAKFDSSEGFGGCPFMRGKPYSRHHGLFHGGRGFHESESELHRHRKCDRNRHELAEKVELLYSMGFPPENKAHYEELLKRFDGKIGHVVEILLCERKRKEGGKDKEHEDGGENNEGETSTIIQDMEILDK